MKNRNLILPLTALRSFSPYHNHKPHPIRHQDQFLSRTVGGIVGPHLIARLRCLLNDALLTIALVLLPIASFSQVNPPGNVAWWRGEGNATDSSGGNNGSLQGGVTFTPGEVGDAFNFDGSTGFIEIANGSSMDFGSGDFTVVAWVRFGSLNADQEIIHKVVGTVPNDQAYFLEYEFPNSLRFMVRETAANQNDLTVPITLVPGNWYLVAGVRSGNTNRLYLNGSLLGSQVAGSNANTGNGGAARIGRLAPNGSVGIDRFFNGAMDEISLFNRALTGSEILGIFNSENVTSVGSSLNSISFQGALNDPNGQPLPNGNYTLTFKFYDVPTSGIVFGTSTVSNVMVSGGIASTSIPVDANWFDGQTRYLGVAINNGQELTPRVMVTAVPFALRASSLTVPDPFDSTSYVQQQQGLELRWYQNTPFIDLTGSPNPVRDFDYRIYVANPSDPLLVFRSDISPESIVIRRNGFVGIGTHAAQSELDVNGTARMTVCQITSDRAAKEHFEPIKPRDVLAKLAVLPITTWAYTNASNIRHLGPVAQDFQAAFALGDDDKHIATVDADGVALAAIQGLNQLLQEKESKIQDLEKRLEALERKMLSKETKYEPKPTQSNFANPVTP